MTLDIPTLRNEFDGPHHLITTSDNQILFLRKWESKKEEAKKTAILLFHGITAYSGPYGLITNPLAEIGFNVYGLDLRGHGLSDGNRGDCPSKERFIKDLCESIQFVKQMHSRVVLLGHSLGVLSSLLALNTCLENIDGVVLLSGARTTRPDAYPPISTSQKLKILFNSIFRPSKQVINYHRDGMIGLDNPLFNFRYTYRFMKIVQLRNFTFPDLSDMPVFVGVGDSDELFSVEDCKALFEEVPSTIKMFHVAIGGKHSEFPPGSWDPLANWLDEQFD
ncbi:MAG: alpha/beta fold hydrolase [Candidatus Thorarchaeota archaeon]|jgi:pimeloyl-ACP methyl ester carboxylesterase